MTIITCEHCGPTRVEPHDTKCPVRVAEESRQLGHVGANFAEYTHPLVDPNFLYDVPAAAAAYPIVAPSPHKTVRNEETGKPMCACGYDPGLRHPNAEPGQMWAYVGEHVRQVNEANHRANQL